MTADPADPWGVPAPGAGTYWRLGDADPAELPPHLDRPELVAVGSMRWRVRQLLASYALADRQDADRQRRKLRQLEKLDSEVTRCSWCGEWRMRTASCEVPGCRSPWRLLPAELQP